MRATSAFLFVALFCAGCALPVAPTNLKDSCATETKNVDTLKHLVRLFTMNSKNEPHYLGSGFVTANHGKTVIVTSAHVLLKNIKIGERYPNGVFAEFNEGSKRIIEKVYIIHVNKGSDVAQVGVNHAFRSVAKLATEEPAPGSCVVTAGYSFASKRPARVYGNFFGNFYLNVPAWEVWVDAEIITAHILDGMSGGPVFNKDGEVIAVANNAVVIAKEDGSQTRFSLAIPISELPNLP